MVGLLCLGYALVSSELALYVDTRLCMPILFINPISLGSFTNIYCPVQTFSCTTMVAAPVSVILVMNSRTNRVWD